MGRKNLSMALGGALIGVSLGISGCGKKDRDKEENSFSFNMAFQAVITGDSDSVSGQLTLSHVKNAKGEATGSPRFPKAWNADGGGGYKVECYVALTEGQVAKEPMIWNEEKQAYVAESCGNSNKAVTFLLTKQYNLANNHEKVSEKTRKRDFKLDVALPGALNLVLKSGADADTAEGPDDNEVASVIRDVPYVALEWNKDEKITLFYNVNQQAGETTFNNRVDLTPADRAKLGSISRYSGSDTGGGSSGVPQSSPFVLTALDIEGVADAVGTHKDWSAPTGPFKIAPDQAGAGANDTDGFQIEFLAEARRSTPLPHGWVGSAVAVRAEKVSLTVDEGGG